MTTVTAPAPSRRETRRELRRGTIVQVASQSFLEHGYAATTMSSIAASLGGSKGTLWSYFRSKEELFVAVMEQLTEDFRAQLSLILDPRRDLETALRGFCREFLLKVTSAEGIALYRLVVSETIRFPEIGRIFNERGPQLTQQQLAEFLASAVARGLLECDDVLLAARQLTGLCLSGLRQNLLIGLIDAMTAAEIEQEVDRVMDFFLRAYAPR